MRTMQLLPLRLVTGATPERVLRAVQSRRLIGPAASVSKVARVTGPTPGSELRMAASLGPLSWALGSVSLRAVQSSSSLRAAWWNSWLAKPYDLLPAQPRSDARQVAGAGPE